MLYEVITDPDNRTIADFIKDAANKTEQSLKPQKVSIDDLFSNEYESGQSLEFEGVIGAIPSTITWSGGRMNVKIVERRNHRITSYNVCYTKLLRYYNQFPEEQLPVRLLHITIH